MTKEIIKGFMHESNSYDADAKYFQNEVRIISKEDFKVFSEITEDELEYVGFMEFTDGSMMDFYLLSGSFYYGVEFDSQEDYDNFYM